MIDSLLNPLILVVRTSRSRRIDSSRLVDIAQSLGNAIHKRSSTVSKRLTGARKHKVEPVNNVIVNPRCVENKVLEALHNVNRIKYPGIE